MNEGTRVAIVTGSATGIGAACAMRLADHGYNVVINCTTSLAEAEQAAAAFREAGVEALVVPADVADDDQCRALAQAALDAWGRIDALINNAGRTKFVKPEDFEGLTAEDFQSIYAVNTLGVFQTARAAAVSLRAAKGAIVNVSSLSAFTGLGSSIAYAASKGALNTLTLSLVQTLAPEVRVNAVCPGYVDTRWMRRTMKTGQLRAVSRRPARARAAGNRDPGRRRCRSGVLVHRGRTRDYRPVADHRCGHAPDHGVRRAQPPGATRIRLAWVSRLVGKLKAATIPSLPYHTAPERTSVPSGVLNSTS